MLLDRYLTRIGVPAPAAPDLSALQAVITGHTRSIAFENLDPLTGVEPALDPDGLAAKLVDGRRGGWCFEQNGLLRNALTELGYQVTGLAGRVRYRRPPEAPPQARGHMLLRIDGLPDGPHLVDVGFGGGTPTGVLRLVQDEVQETPNEPCRIVRDGRDPQAFIMETRLGDSWTALYSFDLTPQLPVDYGITNFYLSAHPTSHFRHMLMVSRPDPGVRHALANNQLSIHRLDGTSEQHILGSVAELREVLDGTFGLELAGVAGVDAALQRILDGSS
jgi:arylamine N-acetyltransferase